MQGGNQQPQMIYLQPGEQPPPGAQVVYAQPVAGGSQPAQGGIMGMLNQANDSFNKSSLAPGQPQFGMPAGAMAVPAGPVDTSEFGVMEGRQAVFIKQRVHLGEALAQQVGLGCIESRNQYDIFDGITGEQLLMAQEQSDLFCRICCKPNHQLKLEVYDMRPGVPQGTIAMVGDKPFKLNCCACADICQKEMRAISPSGQLFSTSKIPQFGNGFTPTVETMDRNGTKYQSMKGPTLVVGGLLELVSNLTFNLVDNSGTTVGNITKRKPGDGKGYLTEAFADSDMFMLEFPATATNEQKMAILNNALLLDYIFFEGGPPFSYNLLDQSCTINCCLLYCCGCTCPCTCTMGGNSGGGGGE